METGFTKHWKPFKIYLIANYQHPDVHQITSQMPAWRDNRFLLFNKSTSLKFRTQCTSAIVKKKLISKIKTKNQKQSLGWKDLLLYRQEEVPKDFPIKTSCCSEVFLWSSTPSTLLLHPDVLKKFYFHQMMTSFLSWHPIERNFR